jgi:hypothetical protein
MLMLIKRQLCMENGCSSATSGCSPAKKTEFGVK